jgi:uncharacterized protein
MATEKQVFINLPSTSLDASATFIAALGLTEKTEWAMPTTKSFSYANNVGIFYHDHKTYGSWLPEKVEIADTKRVNSVIFTIAASSKDEVDEIIRKGVEAGGKRGPNMLEAAGMEQACEGMYSRSVLDPDGHLFEVVHGMC